MVDDLGSVRVMTDVSGDIISRHDYLPFGEEVLAGGGRPGGDGFGVVDTASERFTGKERDVESGLDYFGARYFGASLGRFASPDPYNFALIEQNMRAGGLPDAAAFAFSQGYIENPQNWNKYAYVRNNPLTFTDPTGAGTEDGHHLFPERGGLTNLAKDFTAKVKSGPLSGDGWPNQPGFNKMHRAYNDAVEELLEELEHKWGSNRNSWDLAKWKEAAEEVLESDDEAISEFLSELDEHNPGALAAIGSSIAAYRASASLIVKLAAADLMDLIEGALETPIFVVLPDRIFQEEIKGGSSGCLLNRDGTCVM
jgi:RHS repeat-associated protein